MSKLSASNIGWSKEYDGSIYSFLKENEFPGLEIAPTRLFDDPYNQIDKAVAWQKTVGFEIPSMQSIWFGRKEKIFGLPEERLFLINYTKKAIDFANAVHCSNLVFGCPQNRIMPENADEQIAIDFFKEIGEYAASKGTVIGMEANPPVYNTNYINCTEAALQLIDKVDSAGFKLNLDVGTMICNNESAEILEGRVFLINHVHISEPGLHAIAKRDLHYEIRDILIKENFNKYVSIEMGNQNPIESVKDAVTYIKDVFS